VMFAMPLTLDPDVLIADEPTTGLDVTVQSDVRRLPAALQAERDMGLGLITPDTGAAADVAYRIAGMCARRIVARAPVYDIYATPAHPYTKALLESIPRVDLKGTELNVIKGLPPNLTRIPPGCAFAPRCGYVRDRCRAELPPLRPVSTGRASACHFFEEVIGDE